MLIPTFICFIVLISAVKGGESALSNLGAQHCVVGSLTYGRSRRLTSQLIPPSTSFSPCLYSKQNSNHKNIPRRQRPTAKTADGAFCVARHSSKKHMAVTDQGPFSSAAGSEAFSVCCFRSLDDFGTSGIHSRKEKKAFPQYCC